MGAGDANAPADCAHEKGLQMQAFLVMFDVTPACGFVTSNITAIPSAWWERGLARRCRVRLGFDSPGARFLVLQQEKAPPN